MKPGHRNRFAVSAFCSARFARTKAKMRGTLTGRPTAPPRLPTEHHRRHNDGGILQFTDRATADAFLARAIEVPPEAYPRAFGDRGAA